MNPRRVHELMRKHFPDLDLAAHEWVNVADGNGPRVSLIDDMLTQYIGASELVVEVNRKVGGFFLKHETLAFICSHIGDGHIRIANREFTSFVVVASNGVAAGWQLTANISVKVVPSGCSDAPQAARRLP
ncbi:MAG: hypothetical protein M3R45_02365 [Pseudomonadota bacterium]|nr:hypothetical protein [Pseudomonadota bacterium]